MIEKFPASELASVHATTQTNTCHNDLEWPYPSDAKRRIFSQSSMVFNTVQVEEVKSWIIIQYIRLTFNDVMAVMTETIEGRPRNFSSPT